MNEQEWIISEMWDGDGTGGAGFCLPNGLVVFITEWTDRGEPNRMTGSAFQQAIAIRDMLRDVMILEGDPGKKKPLGILNVKDKS